MLSLAIASIDIYIVSARRLRPHDRSGSEVDLALAVTPDVTFVSDISDACFGSAAQPFSRRLHHRYRVNRLGIMKAMLSKYTSKTRS